MKRWTLLLLIPVFILAFSIRAEAKGIDTFDDSIDALKDSVSDDVTQRMRQLGYDADDISSVQGIGLSESLSMIADMVAAEASGPLSSGLLMLAVILLSSLLESYTYSLRYVDTKDVMGVVTSLMLIATLVTPIASLIQSSLDTVQRTASLMLAYVPIFIGIMMFSGHIVRSGGYYATVLAASQGIAQLSSRFFAPLLHIFLALSVSASISDRVKLSGICEMLSKLFKWTLTFAMTVFTAILSIQGIAATAADTVASRAVKFTLSSFIPIVGASVSEAYKTIEGSIDLLRSGVGIFFIIVVIVTFLPYIIRILLWQLTVMLSKSVAETFGINSVATVLGSVSSSLSALMAVNVSLVSVFLISTGVLAAIGGAS